MAATSSEGVAPMPTYLTSFRYPAESWAKLVAHPENRRDAVAPVFESAGGKLIGYWFAFGDADGYAVFEAPDDTTTASLLVKIGATGAVSLSTTKLITAEEMLEALQRASGVQYSPPGG